MTHNAKGFSLVEILMVLTIGGILAVMAMPAVSVQMENARLKKDMRTIASALQLLRLRAISANANAYMVFHESNKCWTAYVDSTVNVTQTATETDAANMNFEDSCAVAGGTFDGTSLSADVTFGCAGGASCANVVSFTSETAGFKPSGLPYQAGTVYLKNTLGTSYRVVVSSNTGRVRSCRWSGSTWKKFDGDDC